MWGGVCVFIAGTAPGAGGPLAPRLPADTAALVRVRKPLELLDRLQRHPALVELAADPDGRAFAELTTIKAELFRELERAPKAVRYFFPPNDEGLSPLLGSESAIAILAPSKDAKGTRAVLLTRASGGAGHLACLGAALAGWFGIKPGGRANLDYAGGGWIAVGIHAAAPSAPRKGTQPLGAGEGDILLDLFPAHLRSPSAASGPKLDIARQDVARMLERRACRHRSPPRCLIHRPSLL